ncbi:hypothetical protein BDZ97DRAFT_452025 [Flammula alnicola]|nr:hypothetical protein BDZ97DRAFT_452025 [Flammula alnicola]
MLEFAIDPNLRLCDAVLTLDWTQACGRNTVSSLLASVPVYHPGIVVERTNIGLSCLRCLTLPTEFQPPSLPDYVALPSGTSSLPLARMTMLIFLPFVLSAFIVYASPCVLKAVHSPVFLFVMMIYIKCMLLYMKPHPNMKMLRISLLRVPLLKNITGR